MTDAHAFLAPSSASTWGPGGCPAYPRMAAAFPDTGDKPEAREGEAAHWVVEQYARGGSVAVGHTAPNGETVTAEMLDGAQAMASDIRELIDAGDLRHDLEARVFMPQIHPTHNWGRADFIGINYRRKTVYNWDFKFGHGYVDAFENWQSLDYHIGAVNLYAPDLDGTWTFDSRIYQPRSFHSDGPVKRWTFGLARYLEMMAELRDAALQAMVPDSPMKTGPHCQHCPARHVCPAFLAVGGAAVDMSLRGVPLEMTALGAGAILRTVRTARERLEDLETGLEAQLMAALRGGEHVAGWELEQGFGREKWTASATEIAAVGAALGKDLSKPLELITPAQARKLGIDEAVISAYSVRPKGEMKLKPVDAKAVRKAFQ